MPERSFVERAWAGEPFPDVPIIDCHCHMNGYFQFYIPKCGIEEMLRDADRCGVDQLWVAPHPAISVDYKYGNELAREAAGRYPDRVKAYLTLNANFSEEYDAQFARYADVPQFAAVKLHPSLHSYPINSDGSLGVFELLTKRGGFALVHTWYGSGDCSPYQCADVVRQYPKVPFIFAHAGGMWQGVRQVAAIVNEYENAYTDTSGFEFSKTTIEEMLNMVDSSKVLFGSDMPYHDLRAAFSRIAFSTVREEVKRGVFAENFIAMLQKNPKKNWKA